jgi:hypothetical protein
MTIVSRMLERSDLPKSHAAAGRNFAMLPRLRVSLLARAAAIGNAVLNAVAPLGYEDKSGFHYGPTPGQRD